MFIAKLKNLPLLWKINLLFFGLIIFDEGVYLLMGGHYWINESLIGFSWGLFIWILLVITPWFFVFRLIISDVTWKGLVGALLGCVLFLWSLFGTLTLALASLSFNSQGDLLKKINWNGTEVSVYFDSGGALGTAKTYIVQEKQVFPGLILSRNIVSFSRCYGVDSHLTTEGIRIIHRKDGHCEEFTEEFRDYPLKPYVHFQKASDIISLNRAFPPQ